MPCSHCKLSGHNKRTCPLLKIRRSMAARTIAGRWRMWVWHQHEPPEPLGAYCQVRKQHVAPEKSSCLQKNVHLILQVDVGKTTTPCGHELL